MNHHKKTKTKKVDLDITAEALTLHDIRTALKTYKNKKKVASPKKNLLVSFGRRKQFIHNRQKDLICKIPRKGNVRDRGKWRELRC
jgi:hypothetical protein